MTTVGERLVEMLEARGVEMVFGIPGVHTIELYRGLAGSSIRHVTPRHEQAAGFMADGYTRATGKPGVAFLITGPGLTNAITAMAQARADSVPVLAISGVNARATLGRGLGCLHELPDQRATMASICLSSERVEHPGDLGPALDRAFALFASGRPGPVHIEIPTDVMALPCDDSSTDEAASAGPPQPDATAIAGAAALLSRAKSPAILVGGGAKGAADLVGRIAERLDAPVVMTANGRGLLHAHPLGVPSSPSLKSVRALLADSDAVLAIGTEFGPTDYDMYAVGGFPPLKGLVRIDVDAAQVARHACDIAIVADARDAVEALLVALGGRPADAAPGAGTARAREARDAAWDEIGQRYRSHVDALDAIRKAAPGAMIVGDSTQAVYAGNLFFDHDRPGGWFNAATGYGALGYGPPAAIGAKLGRPDVPVVCVVGDGGMQFVLAELGTAMDEEAAIVFVVWNNGGFQEIESAMVEAGIAPVGVRPSAPDFCQVAQSYGMEAQRIASLGALGAAVSQALARGGPALVEIVGDPAL
jgi:acetolactate synthase-1/2/3 large subunit